MHPVGKREAVYVWVLGESFTLSLQYCVLVAVDYYTCVQILVQVGRKLKWLKFKSMWETLHMVLPPHNYTRYVHRLSQHMLRWLWRLC